MPEPNVSLQLGTSHPSIPLISYQSDEEQVNTLTGSDPAAPRLLSLTLRRLSHCVVAVLGRCAESMEAAEPPAEPERYRAHSCFLPYLLTCLLTLLALLAGLAGM